jgi:uncharacterized protein (TIGR03790 family)
MRTLFILLFCVAGSLGLRAANSGDEVVVVYNAQMPESKDVAEHYAERRHVPSEQIIGLNLPTVETMTRGQYQDQLQGPLLHFLISHDIFVFDSPSKLEKTKIRYAVLCYGVPLRIAEDPTLIETGDDKLPPLLRRNGAAVDTELCLLPAPDPGRILAISNPLYGLTNRAWFNPLNHILMVARLDGPTAAIARALVDKAIDAETNGLWGRAYFDLRGATDSYKKGDDWIASAAHDTQQYGFSTVIDTRPETFSAGFPMSQIALYAGWYDWNASGPFAQPKVEFMPGAFAYHLQSYSAQTLRSTTKNWCGPLLADGATCTMGCVDEPYLDFTPNIAIFFSRWLAGFSFGEAAYASQRALSWQTTVIGDPLYRPFGKNPQFQHQALLNRHSPLVEWSHLLVVNRNLLLGSTPEEMIGYIKCVDPTRKSPVLTEKLGDLCETAQRPGLAIQYYQDALKLNPTPQQAVRLTLVLGTALAGSGKEEQALAVENAFLKEHPGYPDAVPLYQKMEALALKIGQKSKAKQYALEINRLSGPAK